ncbi:hypothetical protein HQ38_01150 [Porphyromonas crevioricanis]|uniref:Secreted protein n=1 Tax=Porphyromonas crevioricanis TaxID=393921 RepID=A0AB34PHN5_9PORP|nr:hypothetical protein HQ38_01150 [Porphyromonas crevioricanis]
MNETGYVKIGFCLSLIFVWEASQSLSSIRNARTDQKGCYSCFPRKRYILMAVLLMSPAKSSRMIEMKSRSSFLPLPK